MPHTPNAAAGFPHHHQEGPQPAPEHPFPQLGAVEHIGIAVPSLADALPLWEALLGVREYKREAVPREGVVTSFLRTGDTKIELLESTNETGPIGKFLAKRGAGHPSCGLSHSRYCGRNGPPARRRVHAAE